MAQHHAVTFIIRQSKTEWAVAIDDDIFRFGSEDDAPEGVTQVAGELGKPVDVFVQRDGLHRELLWTSDPDKLLRDMFRIWLSAGKQPS